MYYMEQSNTRRFQNVAPVALKRLHVINGLGQNMSYEIIVI